MEVALGCTAITDVGRGDNIVTPEALRVGVAHRMRKVCGDRHRDDHLSHLRRIPRRIRESSPVGKDRLIRHSLGDVYAKLSVARIDEVLVTQGVRTCDLDCLVAFGDCVRAEPALPLSRCCSTIKHSGSDHVAVHVERKLFRQPRSVGRTFPFPVDYLVELVPLDVIWAAHQAVTALSSAARNRSFSAGVPTVTLTPAPRTLTMTPCSNSAPKRPLALSSGSK